MIAIRMPKNQSIDYQLLKILNKLVYDLECKIVVQRLSKKWTLLAFCHFQIVVLILLKIPIKHRVGVPLENVETKRNVFCYRNYRY
mgnify:CR=1 FL=1